jgi:hypothetical protein
MSEQTYAVVFEDSGTTYVVCARHMRGESEEWMEKLEEERYEEMLEVGALRDAEDYQPIYKVEELDAEVLDEDAYRLLSKGFAVQLT